MTESTGPTDDPIEEQLILAREVGREIHPPAFDGFTVELQGQRVNLWWHDRHLRSRAFSDAFVTRRNQLVLVVASVSDPLDPTGLALSIRAFLRARLWANTENPNMMAELEHWAEEDPQWTGCCELAMAILEPKHVLRFARYGLMSLAHRGVDGHIREVDFPADNLRGWRDREGAVWAVPDDVDDLVEQTRAWIKRDSRFSWLCAVSSRACCVVAQFGNQLSDSMARARGKTTDVNFTLPLEESGSQSRRGCSSLAT
jgi:hypothetical protein